MRQSENLYLFLGKNRYCDNLVILIPIIPVKEKVIIDDRNKILEFKKYLNQAKIMQLPFLPFTLKLL